MRVLVLDDDPLTASSLARIFAVRGIQVVSVSTAAAAERTIEAERFDAILVDARADHAKGLRLFDRARQVDAGISLFLVSDRVDPGGRADSDIYYIEKPWDGFFVVDIVRARCAGDPVAAGGATRRSGARDERPTANIGPIRAHGRRRRASTAA